jgi:hypothetical protein
VSLRTWRGGLAGSTPLERAASTATFALAFWLGSLWLLGLTQNLTRPLLLARTVIALAGASVLYFQRHGGWRFDLRFDRQSLLVAGPAFIPALVWLDFVLWRAWIVPPLSHDALSYHLPKAILFVRARAYEYLAELHPIPRKLPSNYELLLSDVMIVAGSDRITEWLSALFWVLFVIAGVAMVQRWYGPQLMRDSTVALLLAGMPVVLLHSGAHKNDLMTGFFMVCALMWGARFAGTGERPAMLLMVMATAMAIGTKPQAGFVAMALVPFVIWRLWKLRSGRELVVLAVASVAALALLGGAFYAIDLTHETRHADAVQGAPPITTIGYGDWPNLWQAPYVLIAAPFSRNPYSLSVPWESQRWFWRRYEIYFSHFGPAFSICALLLPLAIVLSRAERTFERGVASLAALAAFVAMLPVVTVPHGLFTISLPRYVLFIAPVVIGWTIEPVIRRLGRIGASLVLYGSALLFTGDAFDIAMNDTFTPADYVLWARERPGTRLVPFDPNRAALVADRAAGPREKIAMDAGYSSWVYPAFGADLQRPVQLIAADQPFRVDRDATWLVIDRGYDAVWQSEGFRDLSQVRQFIGRGEISAEGKEIMRKAMAEPGFEPVYIDARRGQLVLRRAR